MCRRGGNSQQIEEEESKKAMEDSEEKGGQNKITSQCVYYVGIYVYVHICTYTYTYILNEYLHQEMLKTEHAFVVFLSTHFVRIAAVVIVNTLLLLARKLPSKKSLQVFLVSIHAPSFSLCSLLDCLCRPKKRRKRE